MQFVGLLTYTFREFSQRLPFAFSGFTPMTCFRRKKTASVHTAPRIFIRRVPDSHRIPLFSWTRMRVFCFQSVAHQPQTKPDIYLKPPKAAEFLIILHKQPRIIVFYHKKTTANKHSLPFSAFYTKPITPLPIARVQRSLFHSSRSSDLCLKQWSACLLRKLAWSQTVAALSLSFHNWSGDDCLPWGLRRGNFFCLLSISMQ